MEKKRIFLLTGTNLGDRFDNMQQALLHIQELIGEIITQSPLLETKAWGLEDQPDFLNQALEVQTSLNPQELLASIHFIEMKMGRLRLEKWGPRLIDIDILFYENDLIDTPDLKIPHPYLPERLFALKPMMDIAPNLTHPISGLKIKELHEIQDRKVRFHCH